MAPVTSVNPFRSFWLAGYHEPDRFEGAEPSAPLNDSTQHLLRAHEDYQLLDRFGIRTVRESVGWRRVEADGAFDFSPLSERASAARELGVQIIWSLCRQDWPADVDVLGSGFPARFARYCRETALYLASFSDEAPVYSLIDEISVACVSIADGLAASGSTDRDLEDAIRRQLVRALIAGCDAILEVNPRVRLLHCEAGIHVAAPVERPDLEAAARAAAQAPFQTWDMLSGRAAPELGGDPRYLDLVWISHYHGDQRVLGTGEILEWHLGDLRRRPLRALLTETYKRYGRPIVFSETGHAGSMRGAWIRELAQEVVMARSHGAELFRVCLYPAVERPHPGDAGHWTSRGLWDVKSEGDDEYRRVPSQPYAAALHHAQRLTGQFCPTYMPS